jgi:hypothetical protein
MEVLQELGQEIHTVGTQGSQYGVFGPGHGPIDAGEEFSAFGRDSGKDPTPILLATPPADPASPFQTIQEPGDPRGLLHHAFTDGEGGQSLLAGTTEDSENVELLEGHPRLLNHLGKVSSEEICGAKKGDGGPVGRRSKAGTSA